MKPVEVAGLKAAEREAPREVERTRRSCGEELG